MGTKSKSSAGSVVRRLGRSALRVSDFTASHLDATREGRALLLEGHPVLADLHSSTTTFAQAHDASLLQALARLLALPDVPPLAAPRAQHPALRRQPWTSVGGGPVCSRLLGFLGRYARRAPPSPPCHRRRPHRPPRGPVTASTVPASRRGLGSCPRRQWLGPSSLAQPAPGCSPPPPPNLTRQPPAPPMWLAAPGCLNYHRTGVSPPSLLPRTQLPNHSSSPKADSTLAAGSPFSPSSHPWPFRLPSAPFCPPLPRAPATHAAHMLAPSRSGPNFATTEQPVPFQATLRSRGCALERAPGSRRPGRRQHEVS